MSFIFDREKLFKLGEESESKYSSALAYPHISFKNFLPIKVAEEIHDNFPSTEDLNYYSYDNPLEKKLAYDKVYNLHESITNLFTQFSSPTFLIFLEKLTGIEGLIPDPYFRGGGIHISETGGKLDIHIDFNKHPKLKLERRLNVLIYFNKDWQHSWNGDFQIWEGFKDEKGEHHLLKLRDRVYPIFNTFACFNTSEKSYNGFPDSIKCPASENRKSLAFYYYTVDRPEEELVESHSTVYVKRPGDSDDLDSLRKQRNKGRLNTDIKDDILS